MTESSAAFNALPDDVAAQSLAACLHADEWCAVLVAGRPYASVEELVVAAMAAARSLSGDALVQALAAHPRIGDRPSGSGVAAAFSRSEQSGVGDDVDTRAALRRANVEYEDRFGHVFLIRAAGRDASEVLAQARRRLTNDHAAEAVEVREQLGEIAVLRLREVLVRLSES